ncbi:alpha-glucosidase [Streptomyces sp. 2333.5]|uniref:glycoside hydrolase family 13 protein n=1 Tax=unclassified Streptomyces TaxID=2593676 RepID=UPI00089BADDB|nr:MULTISPECIES: glycoside hydrolase family 13 protein [unclassified Streptomyces]PJJ01576.1 alpha-glucosidase [Streptomyces sp. 2333.5]SEC69528.1 alpha-glucosidase [Streptomyces sp. 2314.4]SED48246.1 alpha-glucosidase [Streptomyces sp. 2112.2]SOE14139.1 alpha-glucosidase [Streptomyces sp. 2323.1]
MTQELTSPGPAPRAPETGRDSRWWRDAVIYQVYVRSFADSDGDGIGDLRGVRERLPYLKDLGVDAVWLTPFYASPQADGGYDVADYRAVDPLFGTLQDADDLLRTAHDLGLRVIVDIVPNHTSDRHPWFQDPELARERYVFRPGKGPRGELPPNDWESVFGGPAWTRTDRGDWYLHLFAPEQPDLNWDNPEVHAEFEAIMRFWLDLGVDGFRIDVAHGMIKAPGLPDIGHGRQAQLIGTQVLPFFDQDGVHAIHRTWRRLLDGYGDAHGTQVIGVAEAWAPTPERLALYVRPDELHQAFNFQFLNAPWQAGALRAVIDASIAATASVGAPTTWVLSNHDVVRHTTRLGGGLARARAATLLMLALPGSAYLYQGEELGLPEVTDLPDEVRQDPAFFRGRRPGTAVGAAAADVPAADGGDTSGQDGFRDGCRVPLPWSGEQPPYGFGPGGSWLPQPADWRALTVAAQTGDPASTLELYRTALSLRRRLPGLGDGPMSWVSAPDGVLAFRRPGVLCTVNTLGRDLAFPAPGTPLLASTPVIVNDGSAVLPGDSCIWWAI